MFSLWHVVKRGGKRGHALTTLWSINTERRGRGKWRKHARCLPLYFLILLMQTHTHMHLLTRAHGGQASIWHFIHIQMSSPIHSPPPLQSMLHLVKPLCRYRQRSDVCAAARGRPGNISRLDDNGRQVAADKRHEVSNYSSVFNCWDPNVGLIHLNKPGQVTQTFDFPSHGLMR